MDASTETSLPPAHRAPHSLLVNTISIFGLALVVVSASLIAAYVGSEIRSGQSNPYSSLVAYLLLPALFVVGLVLVPTGALLRRRRSIVELRVSGLPVPPTFPVLDLNDKTQLRVAVLLALATAAVVAILALVGIKGTEFGDSAAFCGACHTVMNPQVVTYQSSSHAKVPCVQCHIGPGASWFVKAKLSGIGQVVAYTFNTYPRPVAAPIESLRPSRDTCEECHWPQRVYGDRLQVITTFAADEGNTANQINMVFRVGGGLQHSSGIHWHIANEVSYLALDSQRQQIAWVETRAQDGTVTQYADPNLVNKPTAEQIANGKRQMDCIDCHNRSAHDVRSYSREVDRALAEGRLDASLPFLKKQALAFGPRNLDQPHDENYDAVLARLATLGDFYRRQYPAIYNEKMQSIQQATAILTDIYQRSVFPGMQTDWLTYADNIGHQQGPGCFRCHGKLEATNGPNAGKEIESGCDTCHYTATTATTTAGTGLHTSVATAGR